MNHNRLPSLYDPHRDFYGDEVADTYDGDLLSDIQYFSDEVDGNQQEMSEYMRRLHDMTLSINAVMSSPGQGHSHIDTNSGYYFTYNERDFQNPQQQSRSQEYPSYPIVSLIFWTLVFQISVVFRFSFLIILRFHSFHTV